MSDYKISMAYWNKLNIFEQMGNIYSEVGRSFKYKNENREKESRLAMARALDLLNATIDSLSTSNPARAKEVSIAKQQYKLAMTESQYRNDANIESLDRYFYQFALADRLNR